MRCKGYIYVYRGPYLAVLKANTPEEAKAQCEAWAKERGTSIEWDEKLGLGQVVDMEEVYATVSGGERG